MMRSGRESGKRKTTRREKTSRHDAGELPHLWCLLPPHFPRAIGRGHARSIAKSGRGGSRVAGARASRGFCKEKRCFFFFFFRSPPKVNKRKNLRRFILFALFSLSLSSTEVFSICARARARELQRRETYWRRVRRRGSLSGCAARSREEERREQ
jgi:hypothetical protein